MKVRWRMRDLAKGVERSGQTEGDYTLEGVEFFWSEGNWACDVNRWIEFYPEGDDGLDDETVDDDGHSCLMGPGFTRRFEVLALEWLDGDVWREVAPPERFNSLDQLLPTNVAR